jgi:CheY-like chemotaxis protein
LPASGIKVLVIEDERDVSIYMANLLRANGFAPITVTAAAEALAKARSHMPALIVLDAMLPGDDAQKLFCALRTDRKLESIPVVLLSSISLRALGGVHRRGAFVSHKPLRGPEAFLCKPPEAEDFIAVVRRLAAAPYCESEKEVL